MFDIDMKAVNRVLMQLDEGGNLFPQFELSKSNNEPVIIGSGGFSLVYEMVNKERQDIKYALKVIGFNKKTIDHTYFRDTVKIQRSLFEKSKNVVRIIDTQELYADYDSSGRIISVSDASENSPHARQTEKGVLLQFILMEKLERIIEKNKFNRMVLSRKELCTRKEIIKLAVEIGQVLDKAHDNNYLHRDVKLENIFWDEKEQVYKLGDFGVAKFAENGNADTILYSHGYGAPEIEKRLCKSYNYKADIYSFGITLYLLFNNLMFPGAGGYYSKIEAQYNPDFVFPAPDSEIASENITKVIRKMCSYKPEDRHQSISEALQDMMTDINQENTDISELDIDIPTMTYHNKKTDNYEKNEVEQLPESRIQRKILQREIDRKYIRANITYGIVMTLTMVLMYKGIQSEAVATNNWIFWVLPVVVLTEAVFQGIKEFHLIFGAVAIASIGISVFYSGITMPHIIMALAVIIGIPLLTCSVAIATGIWILLALSGYMNFLDFIWNLDLGWIFLIFLLIEVNRYFHTRKTLNKTTYTRAFIGAVVYDKAMLAMALAGIVLLVLEMLNILKAPEFAGRIHFIRTGLITFLIIRGLMCSDIYFANKDIDFYEDIEDEELEYELSE